MIVEKNQYYTRIKTALEAARMPPAFLAALAGAGERLGIVEDEVIEMADYWDVDAPDEELEALEIWAGIEGYY